MITDERKTFFNLNKLRRQHETEGLTRVSEGLTKARRSSDWTSYPPRLYLVVSKANPDTFYVYAYQCRTTLGKNLWKVYYIAEKLSAIDAMKLLTRI